MEKGQSVAEYGLLGMVLVVVVVLVLAFIPMPVKTDSLLDDISFYEHAYHTDLIRAAEADTVRHCLENNGPIQTWKKDDRIIFVCMLNETGKYGIQVITENLKKEITAFIKNKMKHLSQVEQYLKNGGYIRIK